jgi:hypothetical protein
MEVRVDGWKLLVARKSIVTPLNQQQTTINKQQSTNNKQQTTINNQQTTHDH